MTTWHADTDTITAYASGDIDDARAFSLEAHLLACPQCRETCARVMQVDRLETVWAEVVDTIDRPRPRAAERLLRSLGVSEHLARLIGATASLQLSWLLAIAATLAFAVLAAFANRGIAPGAEPLIFLLVAPLVPLAGVATAFGPGVDPTHEIGLAAPMSGFRLLLVRAVAVLGSSFILIGAAAFPLPGPGWAAAAWLLPALALTATSLALSTRLHPVTAAGTLGGIWVAAVATIERIADAPLASFGSEGQMVSFAVAVVAVTVVAFRREAFERERT
ncbi:MAG TPA: zf-HC2 domain-containing protein [Actinomycetota bacterium]|jgi:hypothetical protein